MSSSLSKSFGNIELNPLAAAIKVLREHSGIKRLAFESALVDPTSPAGTSTIPGHRIRETKVPLMSIFSNEASSFPRRPSQEKVDRLLEIMGKQPRWWADYEDPKLYGCG